MKVFFSSLLAETPVDRNTMKRIESDESHGYFGYLDLGHEYNEKN